MRVVAPAPCCAVVRRVQQVNGAVSTMEQFHFGLLILGRHASSRCTAGAESVAIFFRPPIHFETFLSRLRRSFPPHNRRPFRQISLDIVVNISTAHWCPPHNFIARPRCRIVGLFSGGRRLKGGRCSSADQTDVHIPSPDWFRQNRYISTWQPL